MTVLTTEAGRVVTTPKHSIATDPGQYVFAESLEVGSTLYGSDGTPLTLLAKETEIAQGLYSPITASSNYFAGESEKSMILAHNFAHVWKPELFAGTLHRILDISEFFWPHFSRVSDGAHPV